MDTGIILAAGQGTRICDINEDDQIKPLIAIGNLSLLERAIRFHRLVGCKRVVIVLGWQADNIIKYLQNKKNLSVELIFAYNSKYTLQNGVSVLCARDFVEDQYLLTMSDHIFDDRIPPLITSHKTLENGATLCVDYKIETIFDIQDATKVKSEKGLVRYIGKAISDYNCIDTGIFIGTDGLMSALEQVYHKNGDVSLSQGVQLLAKKHLMKTLDIKDFYWQDIDTPEMLNHAEAILSKFGLSL